MKAAKILLVLFAFTSVSFAKSGLELGVFVPMGIGVGIHYYNKPPSSLDKAQSNTYNSYISNNTRTSHVGFEARVLFQAGYRLELNSDMSFSFMGEFGYSRDTLNYRANDINTDSLSLKMQKYRYYNFNSIVIGVLPRFNYQRFSLGIGFGMKIIISGTFNDSSYNKLLGYSTETIKMLDTKNYKNYFSSNIIPYLKVTIDYAVYTSAKFDFVVGAYLGYDFALKYPSSVGKISGTQVDVPIGNMSSVDLGIQIGTRIRPMN
ncbi:hypothetical protein Q5M87_03530 [Brachyspira innocens]|uniref:Serpentine_recp domain containing protein n=1 Tax=Brachyspira innocens TaxID=13264 RepID=A0ABT8YUY2_9SPIR|nr:hypothetical protein [Brachyspira innocens]MDO6993075.1 hypothetical protein [Brachyspira innocens]MDO7019614.1 hypothetical protein [Brachyspira innocens]